MKRLALIASILATNLIALPASAQMEPGTGRDGAKAERKIDCSRAPDPKACEERRARRQAALDQARAACQGKTGPDHRICIRETMVRAEDCPTARDPARCEARKKAHEACRDKTGPQHKSCLREMTPPRDCSKAPNPQRCEASRKAREACRDKHGAERKTCMQAQMPPPVKGR